MSETVQHYLQFRHATVADAAVMAEIYIRSFEEKDDGCRMEERRRSLCVASEEQSIAERLSECEQGDCEVYEDTIIASVNGQALGYITYAKTIDWMHINYLHVILHDIQFNNEKLRVGQALFKKVIGLKQNIEESELSAFDNAVDFYQKMGYEKLSEDKDPYVLKDMYMPKDNIDAWHLTALPPHKRPVFTQSP